MTAHDDPNAHHSEQEGAGQPSEESPEPRRESEPDIGLYVSRAWGLLSADPLLFIVGFLLVCVLITASLVGVVVPLIIGGPLLFGYVGIIQDRLDGKPAEIGDIFDGFQRFRKSFLTFLLLFGIGVGAGLLQVLGSIILGLIPCVGTMLGYAVPPAVQVLLGAALFFVLPVAALTEDPPLEAVRKSIFFCRDNPGPTLLLSLVTQVLASVGLLACLVGYFVTAPLAFIVMVIAYHEYYVPNATETA